MKDLLYFKSKVKTHRFNKNQKVWVIIDYGNFLGIIHKFRNKGRYVKGYLKTRSSSGREIYNKAIGEEGLKKMEIEDEFYEKLENKFYN